jgi:hypothetical protein
LKSQFRSIDEKSFWSYETQVDVVLACCIIHNHIMRVDPYDLWKKYVRKVNQLDKQLN